MAISTVSRVLNGGRASADAKTRVERAIRELGYTPSVAAQSLVTRRTGCVGLAVNTTQSPWFSQILAGIEESLAPSRQSVLIASLMLTGQYDASAVLAWIQERRVDGLIFARYSRRERPLFNAAARAGLPSVLIAPDIHAPASFIARSDNLRAGRLAAQHLAELGHRRVAFAGGPEASLDTRLRLQGVRAALREHGVALRDRHVWFGGGYGTDSGLDHAERFLAERAALRPTAVVLGNDVMAIAFMSGVMRHGVSVPDQVSIVGFDGIPDGALWRPGLTTVVQPTRSMAASACAALLRHIQEADREPVAAVEYGVELLVRESTARPRG